MFASAGLPPVCFCLSRMRFLNYHATANLDGSVEDIQFHLLLLCVEVYMRVLEVCFALSVEMYVRKTKSHFCYISVDWTTDIVCICVHVILNELVPYIQCYL